MKVRDYAHIIIVILVFLIGGAAGYAAIQTFTPETFGRLGFYRASSIQDEADREIRLWTNPSCLSCHLHERGLHQDGRHQTVSCEICHSVYADHVENGEKVAEMEVKTGEAIKTLCLRCHNQAIQARPQEMIDMIDPAQHLEERGVKPGTLCNQCHHVHAPLKYIERAKAIVGVEEVRKWKK